MELSETAVSASRLPGGTLELQTVFLWLWGSKLRSPHLHKLFYPPAILPTWKFLNLVGTLASVTTADVWDHQLVKRKWLFCFAVSGTPSLTGFACYFGQHHGSTSWQGLCSKAKNTEETWVPQSALSTHIPPESYRLPTRPHLWKPLHLSMAAQACHRDAIGWHFQQRSSGAVAGFTIHVFGAVSGRPQISQGHRPFLASFHSPVLPCICCYRNIFSCFSLVFPAQFCFLQTER